MRLIRHGHLLPQLRHGAAVAEQALILGSGGPVQAHLSSRSCRLRSLLVVQTSEIVRLRLELNGTMNEKSLLCLASTNPWIDFKFSLKIYKKYLFYTSALQKFMMKILFFKTLFKY